MPSPPSPTRHPSNTRHRVCRRPRDPATGPADDLHSIRWRRVVYGALHEVRLDDVRQGFVTLDTHSSRGTVRWDV
ncbi:hypothetical protein PsYK624_151660 [Phanerochaete sordida]|uniref:Uncharacterized protein n=1 Tax=Phanerochaete sordida TaxID=48140 RepID=A0A9P3GSZ1_9APHY|nr:hypothetical protein PsYK624_151660 [Phanerochaete sordida]